MAGDEGDDDSDDSGDENDNLEGSGERRSRKKSMLFALVVI